MRCNPLPARTVLCTKCDREPSLSHKDDKTPPVAKMRENRPLSHPVAVGFYRPKMYTITGSLQTVLIGGLIVFETK